MKHDIFFDPDTHSYLVDGLDVPSVTTILKPLTDRGYANINPSVLEYARNRGTAVHEALEEYDLGGEPEVHPEVEGYIRAYLDWYSVYKPTWTGVEKIVYKEGNYIGTLDRVGYLNGTELAIVDLKTSNPTKEALVAVCLQTMAYAEACGSCQDYKRYGLFLKADGTWRFQDCNVYEKKYGFDSWKLWWQMVVTYQDITKVLEAKVRKKNADRGSD